MLKFVLAMFLMAGFANAGEVHTEVCYTNPSYPTKCERPLKFCGRPCTQVSDTKWNCDNVEICREPEWITPPDCSNVTEENHQPEILCNSYIPVPHDPVILNPPVKPEE